MVHLFCKYVLYEWNNYFEKFFKKYTIITESFLDEYLNFYEMCDNEYYGIDLYDVINYLEISNKEKFISRFLKKFN